MDRLHALPPQQAKAVELTIFPFWIGSGEEANARVFRPGIKRRHVAIIERADGLYVVRGEGDARVNGVPLGDGQRLDPGSVLELGPGCEFRFNEQPASLQPRPKAPAPRAVKARRRPRGLRPAFRLPTRFLVVALLAIAALGVGGALFWRVVTADQSGEARLTIEETLVFDSLLREAYDHIERGTALLEIGAPAVALTEFVEGITVLQTHPLHTHPEVAPRILALESSIAAIYRSHQASVPSGFARSERVAPLAGAGLSASLSVDDFRLRFSEVTAAFRRQFGDSIHVTGRDHAEHLSLYGRGSALDLRTRTMTPERVRFVIAECRLRGIRVKDFSLDDVLRQQIEAAIRAGLPERAGTGLHLHVDRFGGRSDRWTVR